MTLTRGNLLKTATLLATLLAESPKGWAGAACPNAPIVMAYELGSFQKFPCLLNRGAVPLRPNPVDDRQTGGEVSRRFEATLDRPRSRLAAARNPDCFIGFLERHTKPFAERVA